MSAEAGGKTYLQQLTPTDKIGALCVCAGAQHSTLLWWVHRNCLDGLSQLLELGINVPISASIGNNLDRRTKAFKKMIVKRHAAFGSK